MQTAASVDTADATATSRSVATFPGVKALRVEEAHLAADLPAVAVPRSAHTLEKNANVALRESARTRSIALGDLEDQEEAGGKEKSAPTLESSASAALKESARTRSIALEDLEGQEEAGGKARNALIRASNVIAALKANAETSLSALAAREDQEAADGKARSARTLESSASAALKESVGTSRSVSDLEAALAKRVAPTLESSVNAASRANAWTDRFALATVDHLPRPALLRVSSATAATKVFAARIRSALEPKPAPLPASNVNAAI